MVTKKILTTMHRELSRVLALVLIGLIIIVLSPYAAEQTGIAALSVWGLFLGGCFIVAAFSHIMRRALFPRLDLQSIALDAIRKENVAGAIVFLGVCIVLAAFLFMNGSMLRI